MKMGILFSGLVWGTFFILLGLSIILKYSLHVDIPVIRLFVAFFLIYLGLKVILDGFSKEVPSPNVVLGEGHLKAAPKDGEYNVLFGKGVIDLTEIGLKDNDLSVEANTIFGSSTIKVKSDLPLLVRANTAFGNARLPDGNTAAVGTYVYQSKAFKNGRPHLTLNLNVVFGNSEVVEQ